jgi:CHRD domain-containing protein/lectin family protein
LQIGASWLVEKQQVGDGFEATFTWQITRVNPRRGAEGFAFVMHNDEEHPFPHIRRGGERNGLGYAGIPNSLAIEFDTVQNPPSDFAEGTQGDPNDNHISVQTRGTEANSANTDFSLKYTTQGTPAIPFFADGAVHTTKISYQPGTLTIFLDDMTDPVLTVPVDLATTLTLDNGTAWVGFTATTGRRSQTHDILSFSLAGTRQSTPTPTPTPEPGATNFTAQLDGSQEVPQRETQATGAAAFQIRDETQIDFSLTVENIENLVAAHIHCAPAGELGAVGITLIAPVDPGGGAVDAFSTAGTITEPDANNGCGWTDMASVVAAMRDGLAYVNVHTDDGKDPPDTGAGDFPDGEIRGQIVATSQ